MRKLLLSLMLLSLALPAAAQVPDAKLDESLRESLQRGCVGTKSVIVRTLPGYRQGLRDTLTQHGDVVRGEFPALEAVAAEVHCGDLSTLAGFASVDSVSVNAVVGVQSLQDETAAAQQVVAAAKSALQTAKSAATAAQQVVQSREAAVRTAQANVAAAQKAAAKASVAAKPAALAAVALAQAALQIAQDALLAARAQATIAQAAALDAQEDLVQARAALAAAVAARKREAQAARSLKKKFFATLPSTTGWFQTDAQLDADDDDLQDAFGSLAGTGGGRVGIAVIDSGIEPGLDFGDRITAFYDFTHGDIRAVTPSDDYGHGTHVAGLIAGEFVGVAPNARLIGLKVLNEKGQGPSSDVVRAIEFAITNKDLLGIQVLNLSLGHPIYAPAASDPLVQAVEHASRAGLVVLVAAGNFGLNRQTGQSGYAGIVSPANAPSSIAVGATRTFNTVSRQDDRIAPYSSRGPSWYDGFAKPDVVAPGDNLLSVAAVQSTLRTAQEKRGNTGNYMRLSGTSMAAGVASGVVALVLEANRGLTPNAVKAVLEYTAIPVKDDAGKRVDSLTQGAGQIEVTGAIAYARAINTQAPMGQPWLSTYVRPSTVIGMRSYAWSQSILWGNHRATGAALLKEQRPAWAMNIVWGNLFGDDDNIVWGNNFDQDDNIVWGNNIVWGLGDEDDNIVWGNLLGDDDNIVWGNFDEDDNIVWGNNVVWGNGLLGMSFDDDNIVWGNLDDDNIVWGNLDDDNIVWGNLFGDDDNIVWGNTFDDDNIVWGNSSLLGNVTQWSGGFVVGKADNARARRTPRREAGVR